jgi:hypothetical protein
MSIIKKMIGLFKPEGYTGKGKVSDNDEITNQRVVDELCNHFEIVMKKWSIEDLVIYPTHFRVIMTPGDYETVQPHFKILLPTVIKRFYKVLKAYGRANRCNVMSVKYWSFNIAPCEVSEIPSNGKASLLVREGHITTIAELEEKSAPRQNNTSVQANVHVSIKLDDSNVMSLKDFNVDFSSIKGMTIMGENSFRYEFDKSMCEDVDVIRGSDVSNGKPAIAKLHYTSGSHNYEYSVVEDLVYVFGSGETREGNSFIKINNPHIVDSHLQIKHFDGRFNVAAFAPTVLNDRVMKESKGGTIHWYDLADNSILLLSDSVGLEFRIIKK